MMKAKRVQYTIDAAFVEQNQANIRAVMQALRDQGSVGLSYASYLHDDGRTFTHLVTYRADEALSTLTGLDAFKHFQAELKNHIDVKPVALDWTLVASNVEG